MSDNQADHLHTPITPAHDRSGESLVRALPDECPTPASGICSFRPFWWGVERRRAGKLPPKTWIRPEDLPEWRPSQAAPATLGWRYQDALARSEGFA